MAISTSGLSVPQLGQAIDTSSYGQSSMPKLETQKGMSLADLVNVSRGNIALQKERALLPSEIEVGQAAAKKATADANTSQLQNFQAHLTNTIQDQQRLINKPDLTAQDIIDSVKIHAKNAGTPDAAVQQALAGLPTGGNQAQLKSWLAQSMARSLSAQGQFEALYKPSQSTNIGGQIVPISQGNALVSAQQPGQQTGPGVSTSIAPQVFANPITGAPMVIGGGGGGGGAVVPQGGGGQVGAQPVGGGQVGGGQTGGRAMPSNQPSAGNQLVQGANESPANFNSRVQATQGAFAKAQDQFNNVNSEFGHIPTIKQINDNILTALKDPSVDTGAVSSYLAHKTGKGSLNPKEQELAKYLEQRIQKLTPKSDADAESKKAAYGSFNLSKEALMDLVRQDNAWVTTQDLQSKGIINNGGNSTNPNYGKVQAFNNQFTQFAQDPKLMKYISIIGEDASKTKLDKEDIRALSKEIGNLSAEDRKKLELKRQTLLKLVGGQ